jgi:hypothetical protein
MVGCAARGRSGITLTEILISILIMGVGVISLATLFPLGLLRLRDAQRAARSGYLVESAAADLEARNLLNKSSFLNAYFTPWDNAPFTPSSYDPFVRDTPAYGASAVGPPAGVSRQVGPGLPIAYDPLWRFVTGSYLGGPAEGRFASGIGFVRNDPDGAPASAWGLQRLTNFNPALTYPNAPANGNPVYFAANTVLSIFVSPEDIVTQSDVGGQNAVGASTIVPAMQQDPVTKQLTYDNDFRFTWMFTGQQSDANNGTVFDGDIVIFENRPFGIDQVNTPLAGLQYVPAGETVVEAVFGYSTRVLNVLNGMVITGLPAGTGYGQAADRVVLLRWPATMPDPEVKVGSWIADVTYKRNAATEAARWTPPDFPYQRCHWYQIIKRTDPGPAIAFSNDPTSYRSMTVWVSTPLKAQTLMDSSTKQPYYVNAALVCPYVVNVFPRTIYSR